MLTKVVNGVVQRLSSTDEASIRAEWALNDPRSLENAKARKAEELGETYARRMNSGFVSSGVGAPHHYATDGDRKAIFAAAYSRAQITGTSQLFYCTNIATRVGALVLHTPAQIAQAMDDAEVTAVQNIDNLTKKLAALDAATTGAQVDAIVW